MGEPNSVGILYSISLLTEPQTSLKSTNN